MTFAAIPPVPQDSDLSDWEVRFLSALKQNVELLTAQRGTDTGSAAVLSGNITAQQLGGLTLQGFSAQGSASAIDVTTTGSCPSIADYVLLMNDIAVLSADLAATRYTVDALIAQLRGS